jgi:hypothetical protein
VTIGWGLPPSILFYLYIGGYLISILNIQNIIQSILFEVAKAWLKDDCGFFQEEQC